MFHVKRGIGVIQFSINRNNFISLHKTFGTYYFRIFGKGLHFQNTNKELHVMFSIRNKRIKFWTIGKWRVKFLKREYNG